MQVIGAFLGIFNQVQWPDIVLEIFKLFNVFNLQVQCRNREFFLFPLMCVLTIVSVSLCEGLAVVRVHVH